MTFHEPTYIELKFNKPDAKLTDGRILSKCFVNAGIVNGYDETGKIQSVNVAEVVGITKGKNFV